MTTAIKKQKAGEDTTVINYRQSKIKKKIIRNLGLCIRDIAEL